MLRRFSVNFAIFSIFLDSTLIALALATANMLRPLLNDLPFANDVYKPTVPLPLYPLFILIWIFIFLLLSVYDGRRHLHAIDEMASITLGSILAGVFLAGLLYISYRDISRLLFVVFVLMSYLGMLTWRLIARFTLHAGSTNQNRFRRVLILGAGPVGRELQDQINQRPYSGLSLIGFVDDDAEKQEKYEDVLGSLHDARNIIYSKRVDDIVIALPRHAHEIVSKLIAEFHNLPVKVWVIPDYFHLALHKATITDFAGLPMLDLRAPALNDYQRMVKRIFDLIAGTVIQIIVSPIMLAISVAIKIDSPGLVLFKQQRVGENGRLFWMYKFRSMVVDADQRLKEVMRRDKQGNYVYKTPDDPRITRVGKFIRRTSLDELPQLFNVLKGDMSLVGPRPELPILVEKYEPWQRKRFAVPQGITGWWQVSGRSNNPMHLHTEEDLHYINNYSILLDLRILLKTLWVVVRGKGAY